MSLEKLLSLNVNEYTEQKNGLTYLSWANAWQEFIKVYPHAQYSIKKNDNGECWFGNSDHGYMVYTSVNVDDLTHEMWLPVMDYRNKSILTPTTFDINKAVMRCLTKNLAMFGLGLYIYAGEDLPGEKPQPVGQEKADIMAAIFTDLRDKGKIKATAMTGTLKKFGLSKLAEMSEEQYGHVMHWLKEQEGK